MSKMITKQRIGEPYKDWFSKMIDDGKAITVIILCKLRFTYS